MTFHPKPVVFTVNGDGKKDPAAPPPFDGLPWGWWQARTTLLAGLCKVTTAWHMAMVLYAAMPSPFGEFRCLKSSSNASAVTGMDWLLSDKFWDWTWDPWVPCDEGEVVGKENETTAFAIASNFITPLACMGYFGLWCK
ncbi:uncharacterized protein LOC127752175 [Frankliniella occidentalis]|uniref:Uncharacterized protein LOC127752175 n=1 Tax=Frankliniella occidentalis TaxID=133901 RepID=A0A9C6XVP2_FRAOC|nr:uncharacterized protein LOC127752175 [Frankliniella occidentalis]